MRAPPEPRTAGPLHLLQRSARSYHGVDGGGQAVVAKHCSCTRSPPLPRTRAVLGRTPPSLLWVGIEISVLRRVARPSVDRTKCSRTPGRDALSTAPERTRQLWPNGKVLRAGFALSMSSFSSNRSRFQSSLPVVGERERHTVWYIVNLSMWPGVVAGTPRISDRSRRCTRSIRNEKPR